MHTTTTNEMVMLTANCVATPLGLYLMTTFVLSVIDANLLVELTLENQLVRRECPRAYIRMIILAFNNNLVLEYKCILWLQVQHIDKHPSSHLVQIKLNPNYKRCFT